jgi:hypothetical protein
MKSLSAADFFRNHIAIKRSFRPYSILSLRSDNGNPVSPAATRPMAPQPAQNARRLRGVQIRSSPLGGLDSRRSASKVLCITTFCGRIKLQTSEGARPNLTTVFTVSAIGAPQRRMMGNIETTTGMAGPRRLLAIASVGPVSSATSATSRSGKKRSSALSRSDSNWRRNALFLGLTLRTVRRRIADGTFPSTKWRTSPPRCVCSG